MSWSELERLVESAELDSALRRALGHCRSQPELVLAARRLGYCIAAADLAQARDLDRAAVASGPAFAAAASRAPAPGHGGPMPGAQLPGLAGATPRQSPSSPAASPAASSAMSPAASLASAPVAPTVKPPLAS